MRLAQLSRVMQHLGENAPIRKDADKLISKNCIVQVGKASFVAAFTLVWHCLLVDSDSGYYHGQQAACCFNREIRNLAQHVGCALRTNHKPWWCAERTLH
jgi:hypothetical protein